MDSESELLFFCGLLVTSWAKLAALSFISRHLRRPPHARYVGDVSELYVYPVKGCAGVQVTSARVETTGPTMMNGAVKDRHFMFVRDGQNISRTMEGPKMVQIRISLHEDFLQLDAPNMPALRVPLQLTTWNAGTVTACEVLHEAVDGVDCGQEAAEWLADFLGSPGRLVYSPTDLQQRNLLKINKTKFHRLAKPEDEVAFSNFASYMIATESSLGDLNSKLEEPVDMRRFRPNIVIRGTKAFEEDNWEYVFIGDNTRLRAVKPTPRCPQTTVDPETGTRDKGNQPLKTLNGYRKLDWVSDIKGIFGLYLFKDVGGTIRVGDPVYVTEKQS